MKLLVDENVDGRLIRWLIQSRRCKVISADKGIKNSHLFALANTENRILLTNDTDFLNTIMYPVANTPGRIILRVFPPTLANQKASLEKTLEKISDSDCRDRLIEVFNNSFELSDF